MSKEVIEKIRLGHLGKKYKPMSEEGRLNIGKAQKGKKKSEAFRENLRRVRTGWKFSEETKEKIRQSNLRVWENGRVHSEEALKKIRQARMKQVIKNKETSIELKIQDLLRENGISFEKHYPILGQPDMFIKPNICIFADGCYWHRCSECGFDGVEKREKDDRITKDLQSQGYSVIRFWEHEIKGMSSLPTEIINSCK